MRRFALFLWSRWFFLFAFFFAFLFVLNPLEVSLAKAPIKESECPGLFRKIAQKMALKKNRPPIQSAGDAPLDAAGQPISHRERYEMIERARRDRAERRSLLGSDYGGLIP